MSNSDQLKSKIGEIHSTIGALEDNLQEARRNERKVHLCFHMDTLKSNAVNIQLDDAKQDNKCLLNILQNKSSDGDIARNDSSSQLSSSFSTMSMVHLQYKYEELLSRHNGLLRMLERKLSEIHGLTEENEKLVEELEIYKFKMEESSEKIEDLSIKLSSYKSQQKAKMDKLNMEKDTLKTVHNQLAGLLHEECMKKNEILSSRIKAAKVPERAQLLKEVQKNNLLVFENVRLRQQNEYFRALLKLSMSNSRKRRNREDSLLGPNESVDMNN